MATAERILTDEMVAAIKAYFPRYPTRQAVTLPALHIVNDRLRYVPLQAVVEIAELLELHPAQVQDTLSFYGFFNQDAPAGNTRAWVCRSIACALRGGEETLEYLCEKAGVEPHRARRAAHRTMQRSDRTSCPPIQTQGRAADRSALPQCVESPRRSGCIRRCYTRAKVR